MPRAVQVYICPWCDRVFRSETERIGHLLTGHGVEVREEEEGEGEEGGATPHPFILPRSHTEEEQEQIGECVMRSACWNLRHGCYKGGNTVSKQNLECFFFRKTLRNKTPKVFFFFQERNS
jgi:hypothetical protein